MTNESNSLTDLEEKIANVLGSTKVISETIAAASGANGYMVSHPNDVTEYEIPYSDTLPKIVKNCVGLKFDGGKLDWDLVPFESVEEIIKVLMVGAKKYKRDNWQLVEDGDVRYFNAAMRHITAWKRGEEFDLESGLPHLAHAGCCILFLLSKNRVGYNGNE